MYDQIARNRRATVVLVAVLFLLFLSVGTLFLGGMLLALTVRSSATPFADATPDHFGTMALAVFLLCLAATVAAFLYGWFRGAGHILDVAGAHPASRAAYPALHNVVEEMAVAAGIPAPRVYMTDDDAPNAFTVGTGARDSGIVVTAGLLRILDRDELQGVVAHEIAHIKNHDTRLMTLLTTTVGGLVMAVDRMDAARKRRAGRFAGARTDGGMATLVASSLFVGGNSHDRLDPLMILVALTARVLQAAVSREREYLADATAALLTRYPDALASALEKIAADPRPLQHGNRALWHLFIVNPETGLLPAGGRAEDAGITARAEQVVNLFSSSGRWFETHPPLFERIDRLRAMGLREGGGLRRTGEGSDLTVEPLSLGGKGKPEGTKCTVQSEVCKVQIVPTPSTQDPAPTFCPRCGERLHAGRIGGKEAWGCARCGGVWMGFADFDEVLRLQPEALDAADRRFPDLAGAGRSEHPACPCCGAPLAPFTTAQPIRVAVDHCPKGHGVWFDDGELSALAWAAKRKL